MRDGGAKVAVCGPGIQLYLLRPVGNLPALPVVTTDVLFGWLASRMAIEDSCSLLRGAAASSRRLLLHSPENGD